MKTRFTLPLVAAALVAGLVLWQQGDRTPELTLPGAAQAQSTTTDSTTTDSAAAEDVQITEMVQGNADAKVTVVEYASFTCPHCAQFHDDTYPGLKRDYIDTGKVRFVYRDVYFDKFGLWASMLARCDGPMRFFGISDMLFDKQREWTSAKSEAEIADNLRKLGIVAGMSAEKVDACMNDAAKAKALVAWYQENATRDDISGTPTLIINGEKYSNMSYEELKPILDEKLAE